MNRHALVHALRDDPQIAVRISLLSDTSEPTVYRYICTDLPLRPATLKRIGRAADMIAKELAARDRWRKRRPKCRNCREPLGVEYRDHPGHGVGPGQIGRGHIKCGCGAGCLAYTHDDIPGFRDWMYGECCACGYRGDPANWRWRKARDKHRAPGRKKSNR